MAQVGAEHWPWRERRNYCGRLCETCTTKRQAAGLLAAFCEGQERQLAAELVQDVARHDFFLDLKGNFSELWRAMPHLQLHVDLPVRNDDEYDVDDGFVVDEEPHAIAQRPLQYAVTSHLTSELCAAAAQDTPSEHSDSDREAVLDLDGGSGAEGAAGGVADGGGGGSDSEGSGASDGDARQHGGAPRRSGSDDERGVERERKRRRVLASDSEGASSSSSSAEDD
ncbi:hypothetical protein JKP88DRAFT_262182 [Tribonema minus]|uniref:Uncharacterized protein n=1 Tax=Tribonema minus TaxID=303371 RepID=A0A835Z8I1_9STRA|nr:hypothetical protein JKP88DRAFT_262182 [Tribonema minus]